ncbi:MAG: Oxygen sensor histidine kinase NreB [Planctomycetes bacterium ADurb.Bin126]|nr:MAG: Oxygen sensor histidine kinase NreB [Planctomycetes bacterium ADurb.Bin126]HOD81805.1 response regulator [Phycisphaerae bacterium]HQL75800.1 response regulator [Phycisphaerae bacterium]
MSALLRLLLVEDNPADAALLRESLNDAGGGCFDVTYVDRLSDAIRLLHPALYDAVLLDLTLPDSQGLATLDRICLAAEDLPIIVLTGLDDEAIAIEAVRKGAQDYMVKGQSDSPTLVRALQYAIERAKLQRELHQLNETLEQRVAERTAVAERRARQLRALASQLTLAEQRERRRLARLLHDHLQQLLVGARFHIAALRRRCDGDDLDQAFQQVEDLLAQSIQGSRSLTMELSPPVLYDEGLGPALHWLAHWMFETHHLEVHAAIDPSATVEAEDMRVLLFQAVRELLFNVVKHAQVRDARLSMQRVDGSRVRISVEDAGVGFDPSRTVLVETGSTGLGLFSLGERMEIMGGSMEIQSQPGQGTSVCLFAPVSPSDQEEPHLRLVARGTRPAGTPKPGQ